MTVSELAKFDNALKEISIDFSGELDNMIDALRMVKSESEIEKIKKAQKIAEGAFDDICGFIKPGVTEKEIALRLEYYMLTHGAEGLSFETIAVSGKIRLCRTAFRRIRKSKSATLSPWTTAHFTTATTAI